MRFGAADGIWSCLAPADDPGRSVAVTANMRTVRNILGLLLLSGKSLFEIGEALLVLFIVQGVLSALFVAIVGDHWKSIATAFGLAWYGFLNPVLAIGWLEIQGEATSRTHVYLEMARYLP